MQDKQSQICKILKECNKELVDGKGAGKIYLSAMKHLLYERNLNPQMLRSLPFNMKTERSRPPIM